MFNIRYHDNLTCHIVRCFKTNNKSLPRQRVCYYKLSQSSQGNFGDSVAGHALVCVIRGERAYILIVNQKKVFCLRILYASSTVTSAAWVNPLWLTSGPKLFSIRPWGIPYEYWTSSHWVLAAPRQWSSDGQSRFVKKYLLCKSNRSPNYFSRHCICINFWGGKRPEAKHNRANLAAALESCPLIAKPRASW